MLYDMSKSAHASKVLFIELSFIIQNKCACKYYLLLPGSGTSMY